MKLFVLGLTLMGSVSALAGTTYTNDSGCTVDVEEARNGSIYYVTQNDKTEVIGVTKDLKSGTFAYCADKQLNVNSFEGSQGAGIMLSCSEHENDHATTRGRVDIEIIKGDLQSIRIDGQVKRIFSWKQDVMIDCSDLVKK